MKKLVATLLFFYLSGVAGAQDLNSEKSLESHLQWNRIEGIEPKVLKCRLSQNGGGDLQCVSDVALKSVACEAFHFSKKTPVKAMLRGRAFTCDGTNLDHKALVSQWQIHLLSKSGSKSSWRVDSVSARQMEKLYFAELESLDFVESKRNYYLSLGSVTSMEDPQGSQLLLTGFGAKYGNSSFVIGVQMMQSLSLIPVQRRDWMLQGDLLLSSEADGRGWLVGVEAGKKRWGFDQVSVRCLGLKYRWNPGNWRSQVKGGNCWYPGLYPDSGVSFAPVGAFSLGRLFWGHMLLEASVEAVYRMAPSAFPDAGGVELRGQLGVSFELFPE